MRLLLDTHAFLWFVVGSSALSVTARSLIEDEGNEKLVSIASAWEMAIKASLGRLAVAQPFDAVLGEQISRNGFSLLSVSLAQLATVSTLPFHHRDPFDRLLVAQAMVEQLDVISVDDAFDAYGVRRLW